MVMKAVIKLDDETGKVRIISGLEGIQAALSMCKKITVTTSEGLFELWLDGGALYGKKMTIN